MTAFFSSHLTLAHAHWKAHIKEGDYAIDATCGNGHDTLLLAELVGEKGHVFALDIQEQALENTRLLVKEKLYSNVSFYQQSHAAFPKEAYSQAISLIVYNLGYLPGGDKQITTQTPITLASLEQSLSIIAPGGIISVACYPGHPEGKKEEEALAAWLQTLSPYTYTICHHHWINRRQSPSLLLIQRNLL